MLPGDWTCGGCGDNVFAKHHQCGRCRSPRWQAARVEELEPGQRWCSNHRCAIVLHRNHPHCHQCGCPGTGDRPEPPGPTGEDAGTGGRPEPSGPPPGRKTHVQGPPVREVQADLDDCIQWMQALLVPDKPAGILPGWPEKPGHVEVYKLSMPGGVFACLPGVDSAKVARMWDLDAGDLMQALQRHHRDGAATDAGPTFYLGQCSHGAGYEVLLMPKWVAGLDLWSDGTVGPAGDHIAGLPASALPSEGRNPLRQQPVPSAGPRWPHPPRQRSNQQEKPKPPPPQPLDRGTPGPPPADHYEGPGQRGLQVPEWGGPGKVDEEAKDLELGPGRIARMGGRSAVAKSLAARYWKLHKNRKRPAGQDCYGAPDPAFAKQQAKQAEDQWGRGMDPWARRTADMYQEELQKAHVDTQCINAK